MWRNIRQLLNDQDRRRIDDILFNLSRICPGRGFLVFLVVFLFCSNLYQYNLNSGEAEAEPNGESRSAKHAWGGEGIAMDIPSMTVYEAHTSLNLKSKKPYFIPDADHSVEVNGKKLTVDDIVFGYDLLYEERHMFSMAHFMGIYLSQDPNDAFALHDLFWRLQPDLLIELGTDSGGSAIFYSSFMRVYNPEITIDPHNNIEKGARDGGSRCPDCIIRAKEHFLWDPKYIHFIQGIPSDQAIVDRVKQIIEERGFERIVVMEDGQHYLSSVLDNINAYDQFVTVGSYLIVQDTKLDRIWNNVGPMTAVEIFLEKQGKGRYVRDNQWEYLLYSQHHGGFLRKIKE